MPQIIYARVGGVQLAYKRQAALHNCLQGSQLMWDFEGRVRRTRHGEDGWGDALRVGTALTVYRRVSGCLRKEARNMAPPKADAPHLTQGEYKSQNDNTLLFCRNAAWYGNVPCQILFPMSTSVFFIFHASLCTIRSHFVSSVTCSGAVSGSFNSSW